MGNRMRTEYRDSVNLNTGDLASTVSKVQTCERGAFSFETKHPLHDMSFWRPDAALVGEALLDGLVSGA